MMEDKISMTESIDAGAPSIKYDRGDVQMGGGEDMQGKQVAAQIWEQMEQEQKVQFGSFDAFFESGIWKQIIQQMQADAGGAEPGSEMMSENVNMQEQMPGGGIADVDMREQVQMAANGGRMGYNMGGGADMGAPQKMYKAEASKELVTKLIQKMQDPNLKDYDRAMIKAQLNSLVKQPQMPGGGIADVDMREQVQMRANGGLMGLYNRGM